MQTIKMISVVALILICLCALWLVSKGCYHVDKQLDNAIINYEEFQSMYNACNQINTDLCTVKDVPDTDKMFEQISKQQRITGLKQKLNRWVEEYNAKSKMFNRSLWKSNDLPYQLTTNQFNCY
jgi:hypothetical protein